MSEPNPIRQKFQAAVEARDKKCEKIDTGELGVDLWCRVLRAKAQSKFSSRCSDRTTPKGSTVTNGQKVRENYAAEYLSICLCDETGNLLFDGENGVTDLEGYGAPWLGPILDECQRVNGEKADIRKNSETTGEKDSNTASPVISTEPAKS